MALQQLDMELLLAMELLLLEELVMELELQFFQVLVSPQ
jgi:hypothetical protein